MPFYWIHLSVLAVFWWSFVFSIYRTMLYVNSEFYFFLLIWIPFISFVVWFLWLRFPVLCWIQVVRLDILVLFLTRRKAFSFSLFRMMLAVGFSYMVFIRLKYVPSKSIFFFKSGMDVVLCQILFSAYIEMIIQFLSFLLWADVSHWLICEYGTTLAT